MLFNTLLPLSECPELLSPATLCPRPPAPWPLLPRLLSTSLIFSCFGPCSASAHFLKREPRLAPHNTESQLKVTASTEVFYHSFHLS